MKDYLIKNYKIKTYKEMMEDLKISESSIYRQLKKLGLSKLIDEKEFIEKSKKIHGDKYIYDNIFFKSMNKKVEIICKKHGVFTIKPSKHIYGQGCKKCGTDSTSKKLSLDKDKFIKSANKKHKNIYDYSLVEIKSQYDKVKIICSKHGEFFQRAKEHIAGSGCPKCSKENNCGYSRKEWENKIKDKNLKFYYIKCWNEEEIFYKIGLTTKNKIEDRFCYKNKMPYNYEIISFLNGGIELYDLEVKIKKSIIDNKYLYIPKIKFGGSRYECFTEDFIPILKDLLNEKTRNSRKTKMSR